MKLIPGFDWRNISKLFFEEVPSKNATENDKDKRLFTHRVKRRYEHRLELKMKNWRNAIHEAENIFRPRRVELYALYFVAMEDDHLLTQVRTARKTVKLGDFIIERDGKEVSDLKKYFERPWFYDYLEIEVDTELWGHSLVEFNPDMEDGEFKRVFLIPREHVRPETGEIVLDVFDETGIPFRDVPEIQRNLVEVGARNDLGLLKVLSKLAIKKEYALNDWDLKNEKFGMPFIVVKTASRNKEELDAKEEMAANFGANAYAILDDQDTVEFAEQTNVSNGHLSYLDRVKYADEAISRLVNGQTGTTDEKAYVGSAEVHERILNDYTLDRMRRIQYNINFALIPFLIDHGYPLKGVTFKFKDLIERNSEKRKGTMDSPADPPNEDPEKKKISPNRLHTYYEAGDVCCDHDPAITLAFDLGPIVDKAIRKVYEEKLKTGDLDAETWRTNTSQIWQATQEGMGKTMISTAYQDPSFEMMAQFRNNIFVFSAFKNHSQISDLVGALTDPATGKPRSWNDFKAIAQGINKDYFENWLQAEYDTAYSSAQMAEKWQGYQRNKDILPMLQYVTQQDDRVRESHMVLQGATLPIDDPFWDEFYPPNGWRCRCTVIQVAGEERRPDLSPSLEQVPDQFRYNVAKSAELFPQSHPYFEGIPEDQRMNLLRATSHLVYQNYDGNYRKVFFDQSTGGFVVHHLNHTSHELRDNIKTAKRLAQAGEAVELLDDKIEGKSPDALVSGLLYEFKITGGSASSVQNLIRKGKNQASRILLKLPGEFIISNILRGMMRAVNVDKENRIKSITLLFPDETLIELSRKEIEERNFNSLKNYLNK